MGTMWFGTTRRRVGATRRVGLLVTGAAVACVLVATTALADSRVVSDGRDAITHPAAISRMVVSNNGPQVVVRVRHVGPRWRGAVRISLDVTPRVADAQRVAVIPRRAGQAASYRLSNGSDWRCRGIYSTSDRGTRVTTLSVPRVCVGGAARVAVSAEVRVSRRVVDQARSRPVPQQSRPNIVFVMVDDMRLDDLEYMPLTRELIGGAGVTFDNAMSPYPLCCPARASVLSGLYSHNHRVWSHLEPWGFKAFDDSSTIATWLDDAGYRTSYLGKYLNGYGKQPEPGKTEGTSVTYVPPGWDQWRAAIDGGLPSDHPANGGTYRFFDTTLTDDGLGFIPLEGRYQTRAFTALEAQQIAADAASARPFFHYVSFAAPHHAAPAEPDDPPPVQDAAGNWQTFPTTARPGDVRGLFDDQILAAPGATWLDPDPSDRPEELRDRPPMNLDEQAALAEVTRQRAESLVVVDRAVARIIQVLRQTGELEETFVVFTSDNGYFLGEQGIRQGKVLPYEAALRVPLLMRGPGIPAGGVREDPFTSIDIAPTLAEMGGVTPSSQVDGVSLLGVARYGDLGWTRPVLVETGPQSTVRQTDESGQPLPPGDPTADIRFIIGIRTQRYLYTHRANDFEELYDLALDPLQYDNVADSPQYARVLEQLRAEMSAMRACDGAGCARPLPDDLATSP